MMKTYCHFFFQAEDGIRDVAVTGVQTCALPISAIAVAVQQDIRIQSEYSVDYLGTKVVADIIYGADRKSVVQGKSVDLGGRRIIKKKKKKMTKHEQDYQT